MTLIPLQIFVTVLVADHYFRFAQFVDDIFCVDSLLGYLACLYFFKVTWFSSSLPLIFWTDSGWQVKLIASFSDTNINIIRQTSY